MKKNPTPGERGKRLLAVDTTTFVASVALCEDGAPLAELTVRTRVTHSESLLADIHWLLGRVGWPLADLDGFAVALGPGSFTGVRIGITTCRTLAWTLGKPLVGCGSLAILAANGAGRGGLIVPLLDARKKEVYVAAYRVSDGTPAAVLAPAVFPPERALAALGDLARAADEPLWLLGDGVAKYPETFRADALPGLTLASPNDYRPRAANLGSMGHAALEAAGWDAQSADPKTIEPVYIRASEAEIAAARREAAQAAEGCRSREGVRT